MSQDDILALQAERHQAALKWAFGLFLGIETIPFIVLFTVRYELDGWYVAPTVNQWMGALDAFAMLISMGLCVNSLRAIRKNHLYQMQRHMKWAATVGGAYLALLIYEWSQMFVPVGTRFGETFYPTLGVSAFYTLAGIIGLVAVAIRSSRVEVNSDSYWDVQAATWYWVFQGIVAIVMYMYLYWI